MGSSDHHSEYLARAVAALTPEGSARVDAILAQLAQSAGHDEWLVKFAMAREAEADAHALAPLEVEPGQIALVKEVFGKLTEEELRLLHTLLERLDEACTESG